LVVCFMPHSSVSNSLLDFPSENNCVVFMDWFKLVVSNLIDTKITLLLVHHLVAASVFLFHSTRSSQFSILLSFHSWKIWQNSIIRKSRWKQLRFFPPHSPSWELFSIKHVWQVW
jgi:hypothetical protein